MSPALSADRSVCSLETVVPGAWAHCSLKTRLGIAWILGLMRLVDWSFATGYWALRSLETGSCVVWRLRAVWPADWVQCPLETWLA
ncbi:hypothetical protein chiPu_0021847 [Chiloscyllium punctatum]|uniref:Uncharacterized protein n=1 Tax=Chiloscyllium punctatum TaxID=137246 RepID=A0A401RDX9_CHIPU|nr:hypothetical protein [Chiloscyllium punctatum]